MIGGLLSGGNGFVDLLSYYVDLLGDSSDDSSVVNKLPMDEEWSIINSLYYCSSLYTTVGEVTFPYFFL